jgi:hypothetical protein
VQILRRIFIASALLIASLAVFPSLAAQADSSVLSPGQTLPAGGKLLSPDGHYQLIMQTDGNLVDYSWPRALWASNTADKSGADLEMQTDGNLVIYAPGHIAVWASNTAGKNGSVLFGQNDGNFVLYAPGNVAVWSTNTANSSLGGRIAAIGNAEHQIPLTTMKSAGQTATTTPTPFAAAAQHAPTGGAQRSGAPTSPDGSGARRAPTRQG